MDIFPPSLEQMIDALTRLPGVGRKTAQRYAFHLLRGSHEDSLGLAEAVREAVERIRRCERCGNYSETALCAICRDTRRDETVICVVEEAVDIAPFDRSGFNGLYHVLGGLFSPLQGIVDAEQLRIRELFDRLRDGVVREVIAATPTTPDGEATALWLARALRPYDVKMTRLGMGMPMGGSLEYVDENTLQKALECRLSM